MRVRIDAIPNTRPAFAAQRPPLPPDGRAGASSTLSACGFVHVQAQQYDGVYLDLVDTWVLNLRHNLRQLAFLSALTNGPFQRVSR